MRARRPIATPRPLAAIVLYGGWLLLFNPDPHRLDTPLRSWKRTGDYDTAYVCEQKKREKIAAEVEKAADRRPDGASGELALRYRCERAEHVGN